MELNPLLIEMSIIVRLLSCGKASIIRHASSTRYLFTKSWNDMFRLLFRYSER